MRLFSKRASTGQPVAGISGSPAKKITFSDVAARLIIDRRVSDLADATNQSSSAVYEDALTRQLLPEDPRAYECISQLLLARATMQPSDEYPAYGIRDLLIDLFTEAAYGSHSDLKLRNLRSVVEFGRQMLAEHGRIDHEEPEESWNRLMDAFDDMAADAWDGKRSFYKNAIRNNILQKSLIPHVGFDFVLRQWPVWIKSPYAIAFLVEILTICRPWNDSPRERVEAQALCQDVMSEWTLEEDKAEAEQRRKMAEEQLMTYHISNGDIVRAPIDWIPVNPSIAPYATCVYAVEVKFGERYNAPHFLVFYEESYVEPSDSEKEEYLAAIEKIWPELSQVREDQVELAYGPDGGVLNQADVKNSPAIGFFPVPEQPRCLPMRRPNLSYGAVIVRKHARQEKRREKGGEEK